MRARALCDELVCTGNMKRAKYADVQTLSPIETPRSPDPTAETPRPVGGNFAKDTTFEKWADITDRYHLERILGSGSYGEVASAIDRKTGERTAVKRIHHLFDVEMDTKRIVREIHLLRHLKHDNIVKLLDVITPRDKDFNELYLVFEFVETDLHKLISTPQYLSIDHVKYLLYQLLCALKYMHSASVIHRDIKPANILINEDCALKVCDFGLARVLRPKADSPSPSHSPDTPKGSDLLASAAAKIQPTPPPKQMLTRQLTKHVVTRWYRPPELILLQEYTTFVDIWSVGCIFAELLSMEKESVPQYQDRQPLFPGRSCFPLSAENDRTYKDQLDQLNVIFDIIGTPKEEDLAHLGSVAHYLRGLPKKQPKDLAQTFHAAPPEAIDLLNKMLVFNPDRRIPVSDALAHPFLESMRAVEKETVADTNAVTLDEALLSRLSAEGLKSRLMEEISFFSGASAQSSETDGVAAASAAAVDAAAKT